MVGTRIQRNFKVFAIKEFIAKVSKKQAFRGKLIWAPKVHLDMSAKPQREELWGDGNRT